MQVAGGQSAGVVKKYQCRASRRIVLAPTIGTAPSKRRSSVFLQRSRILPSTIRCPSMSLRSGDMLGVYCTVGRRHANDAQFPCTVVAGNTAARRGDCDRRGTRRVGAERTRTQKPPSGMCVARIHRRVTDWTVCHNLLKNYKTLVHVVARAVRYG